MEYVSTEYLALLGALTGSFALIWDIVKWARNGAKFKINIRPNTFYPDGKITNVEKCENGERKTYATYYHIEIVNAGNQPSTLLDIEVTSKPSGLEKLKKKTEGIISYTSTAFTPHFGKKLPQVIGPGEVWSCRIEEEKVNTVSISDFPKLYLTTAHKSKPIICNIKVKKKK